MSKTAAHHHTQTTSSAPTNMARALIPGTPARLVSSYASLATRARSMHFGLIEEEVVVLDTETTGLSPNENELIEIAAAVLRGHEIVECFDTFVQPVHPIPPEISKLTNIANADVAGAPAAAEAVSLLVDFVGKRPIIAHNARFDRSFIESVPKGCCVSDVWIDSLALSRIALPRLVSHKLAFMAELFGCPAVSHRAIDDVRALCGVWPVLLCGLSDLPAGFLRLLASMHPSVSWAYRPIFSQLAGATDNKTPFSLADARDQILQQAAGSERIDAATLSALQLPSAEETADDFASGGLVSHMYSDFEPRAEQKEMACAVRDALATRTHCVIEAGTGVGKSMAYLVPFARAAKQNNITVGVATKSNNLADQLIYHELPRLSRETPGGLSFCLLKGFDHYPCLRKVERLAHSSTIDSTCDTTETLTALAVIYAFVCQSPAGDLDSLGIRWKSIHRDDFTTTSSECARQLCPFFPHRCLVHGARRAAAQADVVVTNHSLLLRDMAAEGRILPPVRHWVVDEAHTFEAEARHQWALVVSATDLRHTFEYLTAEKTGALDRLAQGLGSSDAATLYLGLLAKARMSVEEVLPPVSELFAGVRKIVATVKTAGYDMVNVWLSKEIRTTPAWQNFAIHAHTAARTLDTTVKHLNSLVAAVAEEKPELVVDIAATARRLQSASAALSLILDGSDMRYVYSLQATRRLKTGGEALTAEHMDIGAELAQTWLSDMHTIVFTSATCSISGSFEHFEHAVGLNRLPADAHRALHLDSSYDFERNMSVLVAGDMPDPRAQDAYLDALERLLIDIHEAMGGSVLTLFTNRREMEELYERVFPILAAQGLDLVCQLKGKSVRLLREHFLAEPTSSLFALKAFWEGFDASGNTLRCVVIPKLPFASPTEPLSREREARESRAWARYALPASILEVKQAAGRLIRSSSDSGVLVLADSRLVNKGYGKHFLSSLPVEFHRLKADQVGRYLRLWCKGHK